MKVKMNEAEKDEYIKTLNSELTTTRRENMTLKYDQKCGFVMLSLCLGLLIVAAVRLLS